MPRMIPVSGYDMKFENQPSNRIGKIKTNPGKQVLQAVLLD